MKVYLIPGLAADKRVFRHIQLPQGYEACHLEWLPPAKGETLQDYALRMAGQIDHQEDFVLAGLSFGGMLAVEIAKKYPAKKLILIASISHPSQLPGYYRTVYKMGLHRIITPSVLKYGVHMKRYFTAESSEDKRIIREMARDMDHDFIRWAMQAIVHWRTDDQIPEAHHIHGKADGILPHRYTRPTITIDKAGHLMIFDRAAEINRILASLLCI